ncbi:hypothetical protein [Nocardia sp. NBC_00511]|uniref:hypothetical protein n=1 Tax=Nocardia sp. NBC_00511 TaxID=2903591 RepID=UPI0030DF874B
MSAATDLAEAIADAMAAVPGVRPAPTLTDTSWLPKPIRGSAVDIGPGLIEIRVVATELPLRPLADRLTEAVAPILADTAWADTTVRVIVTDVESTALDDVT